MTKKFFTKVWSSFLVLTLLTASIPFQAIAANVVNSNFETYFSNYNTSLWEAASWANGNPFNCTWKPSQVTFSNGKMVLNLDRDYGAQYPYKSGEYRTTQFFGFGYYEVKMRATKNIGVVSSFFTYTGPSDNNPWDEIDIEFLGKDPTKVQFNWYKDGKGNNEYMYNLGFDASQGFHTYGFEWRSNYIDYYVDGKKVYTGTRNIPQTPGKIMMNLWPGTGVDDWLGAFDGRTPLTAEYEYVKYYPNGVPQQTTPPTPTPVITNPPTPTPPTPTPYQPPVLVGDVNGDNSINSIDFGYYRMYLLGTISHFPVGNDIRVGDLDGNQRIDSIDFGYMRSYLLGNINRFPAS